MESNLNNELVVHDVPQPITEIPIEENKIEEHSDHEHETIETADNFSNEDEINRISNKEKRRRRLANKVALKNRTIQRKRAKGK